MSYVVLQCVGVGLCVHLQLIAASLSADLAYSRLPAP